MAKTNKKTDMLNAQKLGIGVGLTTAAVAAVGAYFLYGSKDAPKNRKMVKGWALKAKGEVLQALEQAENITEKEFGALVDGVAKTYGSVQKLSKKELAEFRTEMSDSWKGLVKSGIVSSVTSGIASTAKKISGGAKKTPTKKVVAKKIPAAKKTVAKKVPAKKTVAKKAA